MHQAKKGNEWYFGMKAHIGVDAKTGMVHRVMTTATNVNDLTEAHRLLHGEERCVWADTGYQGVEKRGRERRDEDRVAGGDEALIGVNYYCRSCCLSQGMLPNSGNLVSRSNQDQLGSVASLEGGFVGTGIDQMLGHDATPVLHPALECSQLSITEPAWMGYTQPGEQSLAVVSGCSRSHTAPRTTAFEGVSPGSPVSWWTCLRLCV